MHCMQNLYAVGQLLFFAATGDGSALFQSFQRSRTTPQTFSWLCASKRCQFHSRPVNKTRPMSSWLPPLGLLKSTRADDQSNGQTPWGPRPFAHTGERV
jgi:hypothetical protein